jgi:hypothetical protein
VLSSIPDISPFVSSRANLYRFTHGLTRALQKEPNNESIELGLVG